MVCIIEFTYTNNNNNVIGVTGIVSKSLQKYLETIPGQHSVDTKKTAILGTSHITRKMLQAET
jgi:hypothetical protein